MYDFKGLEERFAQRWNIPARSFNERDELEKFTKRVLKVFEDIDNAISKQGIRNFCLWRATEEIWHRQRYSTRPPWSTNIIDALRSSESIQELLLTIEQIFELPFDGSRDRYLNDLDYVLSMSSVSISLHRTADNGMFFAPSGEVFLDRELVDQPLEFLNPEALAHFIDALKYFQAKKGIESAEKLRRCTEEFLKARLDNGQVLKNNIETLGKRLKATGTDAQIRNVIFGVLNLLDLYFNENSKHEDGDISLEENEFLIYQIGVLLRYIDQVTRTPKPIT